MGKDLLSFIDNVRDNFHEDGVRPTDSVVLVAHNGKRFDIPFLLMEFEKWNIEIPQYVSEYGLDTMLLASKVFPAAGRDIPLSYNLKNVYNFVTNQDMQNAHRAMSDAKAAATILQYNQLWSQRRESICYIEFQDFENLDIRWQKTRDK